MTAASRMQVADRLGDGQTTAAACMHVSRRLFLCRGHAHAQTQAFQAFVRAAVRSPSECEVDDPPPPPCPR